MKGDDVMKITPKDFVFKSSLTEPKTCTYKNRSLISQGEDGNRNMRIKENGVEIGYFCIDTHAWYGYDILSIHGTLTCKDKLSGIFRKHCDRFNEFGYCFTDNTYESINEIIEEVIERIIKKG